MERTTKADLDRVLGRINRALNTTKHVDGLYIERAYGQPRLERIDGHGASNVSPRLPSGQLLDWMDAYLAGIREGRIAAVDTIHVGTQ